MMPGDMHAATCNKLGGAKHVGRACHMQIDMGDHSCVHGPWHYSAGSPLIPMTAKPHSGTLSEIKLLNWLEFLLGGADVSGEVIEGGC